LVDGIRLCKSQSDPIKRGPLNIEKYLLLIPTYLTHMSWGGGGGVRYLIFIKNIDAHGEGDTSSTPLPKKRFEKWDHKKVIKYEN
jgi:hypothetical protein